MLYCSAVVVSSLWIELPSHMCEPILVSFCKSLVNCEGFQLGLTKRYLQTWSLGFVEPLCGFLWLIRVLPCWSTLTVILRQFTLAMTFFCFTLAVALSLYWSIELLSPSLKGRG